MALATHGDDKYHSSTLIGTPAEWEALRVERRNIGSGAQNCVRPECTELAYILSGRARVRRTGDGNSQEGIAREGTSWLVPAGTHETQLEIDGSVECLLVYLPPKLLEQSALSDYGIDPDKTRLAYVGALADPILSQIGQGLSGLTSGKGADAPFTAAAIAAASQAKEEVMSIKKVIAAAVVATVASGSIAFGAEKPSVVLVHGAWANGSSWSKVIPLLQAQGLTVVAVHNPLSSFDADVAATRRVIEDQPGNVVLVGHSYGGAVITEAGNSDKVRALVYVAAFAPRWGNRSIQSSVRLRSPPNG